MSNASRPMLLITNDDGIDSPFLKIFVERLLVDYNVFVAAPAGEQSWISKAISRRGELRVEKASGFECDAWQIGGTPADCVNLAIGHLMQGALPDVVVSGINIGFNVTWPLILGSGTVGGALEGALFGIPAFALSQQLDREDFRIVNEDRSQLGVKLKEKVGVSSKRAALILEEILGREETFDVQRGPKVHNLNFPKNINDETSIVECDVSWTKATSVFKRIENEADAYTFSFDQGEQMNRVSKTDLNCLLQGHITYSQLDYSLFSDLAVSAKD